MSVIANIDRTSDLSIILVQHAVTPFSYMMLWRWDSIRFTFFKDQENFSRWEQGIVFGSDAQIRWRKLAYGFRAVLVTDTGLSDGWLNRHEIKQQQNSGRALFLWGEKEFNKNGQPTGSWFDARIPHVITGYLGYPVSKPSPQNKKVAIKTLIYTFKELTSSVQSARKYLNLHLLPLAPEQTCYFERFWEVIEQ